MFKTTRFALALLIGAFVAQPALAALGDKQPPNMTQAHAEQAAQARAYELQVGEPNFRVREKSMSDRWSKYRHNLVGNLSYPAIRQLLIGNYLIHNNSDVSGYSVFYHAPDGTYHSCDMRTGRYETGGWRVMIGAVGNALIQADRHEVNDSRWGQAYWIPPALVYNQQTGEILLGFGHSQNRYGWVQEEYPAVVASTCPKMPRKNLVNAQQTTHDLRALATVAKPIRSVPAIFHADVRDPLTTWMYLHDYPYQ